MIYTFENYHSKFDETATDIEIYQIIGVLLASLNTRIVHII